MKNNNIFYRVYYTNQDGRTDYKDYTDRDEAIKSAKFHFRAWGWEDETVKVKEYSIKDVDFKK